MILSTKFLYFVESLAEDIIDDDYDSSRFAFNFIFFAGSFGGLFSLLTSSL